MIGMERCPCGQKGCQTYHLTGIGNFFQGSGFTLKEAERIVAALAATTWRPIDDGAKGGKGKPVLLAVLGEYSKTWIVGEAWWNADADAGAVGFWWAGTTPGEYFDSSVIDGRGMPLLYQPLPAEPPPLLEVWHQACAAVEYAVDGSLKLARIEHARAVFHAAVAAGVVLPTVPHWISEGL